MSTTHLLFIIKAIMKMKYIIILWWNILKALNYLKWWSKWVIYIFF